MCGKKQVAPDQINYKFKALHDEDRPCNGLQPQYYRGGKNYLH